MQIAFQARIGIRPFFRCISQSNVCDTPPHTMNCHLFRKSVTCLPVSKERIVGKAIRNFQE